MNLPRGIERCSIQKFCDADILEFRRSVDMSDPRNTEYHISGVSLETDLGPVVLGRIDTEHTDEHILSLRIILVQSIPVI